MFKLEKAENGGGMVVPRRTGTPCQISARTLCACTVFAGLVVFVFFCLGNVFGL